PPHACSSPESRPGIRRRESAGPVPATSRLRGSGRRLWQAARCGTAGCRVPTAADGWARQAVRSRARIMGPPPSSAVAESPIPRNLRRTAARFGDREALVVAHQGYRATYGELVAQCEEVARGLMARGVKKGDRVGIWSPNRYEWVIVQYATSAMGAILVNINPAYRTSELEYALNQSGISFLILAARFRQADYVAMLGEVKGRCPGLREALVLEDGCDA